MQIGSVQNSKSSTLFNPAQNSALLDPAEIIGWFGQSITFITVNTKFIPPRWAGLIQLGRLARTGRSRGARSANSGTIERVCQQIDPISAAGADGQHRVQRPGRKLQRDTASEARRDTSGA